MQKNWILPAIAAALLAGCADPNTAFGRNQHTAIAATAGAIAGGVIGHQMDDDAGRYVGAAAGALAGAALGHQMDSTQNATNQQRYYNSQPTYEQPQYQQQYYQQPQYQQPQYQQPYYQQPTWR